MDTELILGTAGHIDHGKTSLVKALTGVDTDRLPEEKERGITIEPGFARLQIGPYCLGIVDVPGHERFIRQMLSGATGMDLVMLVIAANESIKPQTVEHLEILRLLNLPAGIIVVTKCDLATDEWMSLVEEEIRELVRHSFLATAPIIRTSATTGIGIEDLKRTLQATAAHVIEHQKKFRNLAPFRMAIDRSFSVTGHGAVVTGSVDSGTVEVGATLMVEPGNHAVRVRSLQNHDVQVQSIHRGQRAAMNITGIDHHQIVRGQEIAAPGHLAASRIMTVQLNLLSAVPRPLKDRTRVRFHLGTADLAANLRLLDREKLEPGDSCLAQAYLSEPAVAAYQQSYIIRAESPAATIGGGRIVDPTARRMPRSGDVDWAILHDLAGDDENRRVAASIFLAPLGQWRQELAPRLVSVIDPTPVIDHLKAQGTIVELQVSPSQNILVHSQIVRRLAERIRGVLAKLHVENPLRIDFPTTLIAQRFDYVQYQLVFEAALREAIASQGVLRTGTNLSLSGCGPQLSKNERRLLDELLQSIRAAGVQPLDQKQLREATQKNKESVASLLALAVAAGDAHFVNAEFYLHRDVLSDVQHRLRTQFNCEQGFTVSQLRELLGTTRKYAIPLAEYLDKIGFTRRQGDLRFLVETPR